MAQTWGQVGDPKMLVQVEGEQGPLVELQTPAVQDGTSWSHFEIQPQGQLITGQESLIVRSSDSLHVHLCSCGPAIGAKVSLVAKNVF